MFERSECFKQVAVLSIYRAGIWTFLGPYLSEPMVRAAKLRTFVNALPPTHLQYDTGLQPKSLSRMKHAGSMGSGAPARSNNQMSNLAYATASNQPKLFVVHSVVQRRGKEMHKMRHGTSLGLCELRRQSAVWCTYEFIKLMLIK